MLQRSIADDAGPDVRSADAARLERLDGGEHEDSDRGVDGVANERRERVPPRHRRPLVGGAGVGGRR